MKTAELLETLRTRQPLSWRQVRDRLPLSLPRQSRLDLASDDRYPQESDYGGGSAIVDFLDIIWMRTGTYPSRWATTSWLRPRTLTVMTCSLSGTGMMPSHGSFWRLWPRDAL